MKKRGMSAVITTLIIILLVIVAVAIIWVVVKNLLTRGAGQIELAQKCRDVDFTVKKVVADGDDYIITLSRTSAGENSTGVMIVLSDGTDYSEPKDFGEQFTPLATHQCTYSNTNVLKANQIEMTAYFEDDKGEVNLCPNSIVEEF